MTTYELYQNCCFASKIKSKCIKTKICISQHRWHMLETLLWCCNWFVFRHKSFCYVSWWTLY